MKTIKEVVELRDSLECESPRLESPVGMSQGVAITEIEFGRALFAQQRPLQLVRL